MEWYTSDPTSSATRHEAARREQRSWSRRVWLGRVGLGIGFGMGAISTSTSTSSVLANPTNPKPSPVIDPIERTRPSHLKLSLAAYSFRKELTAKPPTMNLFDFVNFAADHGLDGVEPTSYYIPADADDAWLRKLRLHAFKLGLDISGTSIGNNGTLAPGEARDAELRKAIKGIDHAAVMGAPVVRVFAGNVPRDSNEEEAFQRAVAFLNAMLEHAAKRGVMLALENHGGITATADQMLRLVEAIDSPWFGVNLDSGNFRTADPYGDFARLVPYAVNVHVKTEIQTQGQAKVEADLNRLIDILRDAKYSGYVVLEYEAPEEPRSAIPRYLATLKKILGR